MLWLFQENVRRGFTNGESLSRAELCRDAAQLPPNTNHANDITLIVPEEHNGAVFSGGASSRSCGVLH